MSLISLMRCAPLIAAFTATVAAQGFQESNGQLFTSGLAILNSPQPDTPMGGDTLHVSIDVSGNGRLDLPPYADNFQNGIGKLTMFLYSTVTGLNLTITNGTFQGWSDDTLETPEFLCNGTLNDGEENAGCQDVMLQESSSTVKHINWVWPDCLVGDGGADNGNCNSDAPLDDCLDGTARGPYNISFHELFRADGTELYSIVDLPIRVTNSIPEDTDLTGSGTRPRCALRNNRLIPLEERNEAITAPAVPLLLGPNFDGNNQGGGNQGNGGNGGGGGNNGNNGNDQNGGNNGNNGNGGNDLTGGNNGNGGGVLDPGSSNSDGTSAIDALNGDATSVRFSSTSVLCALSLFTIYLTY